MNKDQIEKLLRLVAKSNAALASATETISDVNGLIVDVVLGLNTRTEDDEAPPHNAIGAP